MSNRGRVATLAAITVFVSSAIAGAGQGSVRERLARSKSVKCVFPTLATGDWTKGTGEVKGEIKRSNLSVSFDTINADEGTARLLGPYGSSDIIVRLSGGALHFVQMFREGPLYATTIFPSETVEGKLKAVHTRHELTEVSLPGFTSRPEQYYGDCEIEK